MTTHVTDRWLICGELLVLYTSIFIHSPRTRVNECVVCVCISPKLVLVTFTHPGQGLMSVLCVCISPKLVLVTFTHPGLGLMSLLCVCISPKLVLVTFTHPGQGLMSVLCVCVY